MQTKVEGIVLNKTVFKERDLIVHLLQRNGKKISILFFGGRGGGAKSKPSLLELGYMLKVELKKSRMRDEGMYVAEEWSVSWQHNKVRYDFKAFSILAFYLELINKVALNDNLHEDEGIAEEQLGLFRVLSNALFYLEKSLEENAFIPMTHLSLFLCKLTFDLGIAPSLEECTFCGAELNPKNILAFESQHGGFACTSCNQQEQNFSSNLGQLDQMKATEFWLSLLKVWNLKYQSYKDLAIHEKVIPDKLMHYLCFQFSLDPNSFKSYKMIA